MTERTVRLAILDSYGVRWTRETFARDLLQNFFDAATDFRTIAVDVRAEEGVVRAPRRLADEQHGSRNMDRGFLTLPRKVPGSFARSFGAQARGLGPADTRSPSPPLPGSRRLEPPRVPRRGDGWRTCRQSHVFEDGDHRHGFGDRAMDPPPPSARAPEPSVIDDDGKPVHKSPVGSDTGDQVAATIEIHTEDDHHDDHHHDEHDRRRRERRFRWQRGRGLSGYFVASARIFRARVETPIVVSAGSIQRAFS